MKNEIEILLEKIKKREEVVREQGLNVDIFEMFYSLLEKTRKDYDGLKQYLHTEKYQDEVNNYYSQKIFRPIDDEIWNQFFTIQKRKWGMEY